MQRHSAGHAPLEHKEMMLSIFQQAGSLGYTANVLGCLEDELLDEIAHIENATGKANPGLKSIIHALQLSP